MSLTKKTPKRKALKKRDLPASAAFTKSRVPFNEHPLPEKFKEMDEMLKKTTFLQ